MVYNLFIYRPQAAEATTATIATTVVAEATIAGVTLAVVMTVVGMAEATMVVEVTMVILVFRSLMPVRTEGSCCAQTAGDLAPGAQMRSHARIASRLLGYSNRINAS